MQMGRKLSALEVGAVVATAVILSALVIVLAVCFAPRRGALTIPGTRIPKVIWMYWNSDRIPPFLRKCVHSWRCHHPDFKIIVLTPATLGQYMVPAALRVPWNDGPAREADIVRANVLAVHGGVWSDISIMLYAPCPQLQSVPAGAEFIGFYLDGYTTKPQYPVIENWWFAAAPGGDFIVKWRDAFMHLHGTLPIGQRLGRMQADGVDLQNIAVPLREYLFMHAAAQHVLQTGGPSVQAGMHLSKAEDGPYSYLFQNAWNSQAAVKWLAQQDPKPPMIKLRSVERQYAEQHL